MNKKQLEHSLLLLLAAGIWGTAFVAQSVGMDYVGPFTFNTVRNILGGLVLIPVYFFVKKLREKEGTEEKKPTDKRLLIKAGLCCGLMLYLGSGFQQVGIQYTSVGKAGFLTAMYIVLVPLLGIFIRKKVGLQNWIGVALAVLGLYFLCIRPGESGLEAGDFWLFGSALAFSIHILVIDHFSPKVNGIALSSLQFFVCAFLSAITMFLTEEPKLTAIKGAWPSIAYAGILSSGVAFTIQIIAQRDMNPTVASLIMSLESVISLLAGWLILNQVLSGRELIGCGLMFTAIILVQLPFPKLGKKQR